MEIKSTQAKPDPGHSATQAQHDLGRNTTQVAVDPGRASLGQFDLILFLGFFGT